MARTIVKMKATVTPDRRLIIDLPEDAPLGEAVVEVRVEDSPERPGNVPGILESLAEIREQQRNDPNFKPRSKEEIDESLRIERESWD